MNNIKLQLLEVPEDGISIYDTKYDACNYNNEYCLQVYVDKNKKLNEELMDKDVFLSNMESHIKTSKVIFDTEEKEEVIRVWNFFKDNFDDLINKADIINLIIKDNLSYLNNNLELKNKNILLDYDIKVTDIEKIDELYDKYKDYPNIFVNMQGNRYDYVKLEEAKQIIDELNRIATYVKLFNLSELENIMFVYDMVRDREYIKSDNEDRTNLSESRDLKNVLFGKSIVCEGYANIFACILNMLGIKADVLDIIDKDSKYTGHARTGIYIDDNKYNIKGYYYFDPTWDSSPKNKKNNNFLCRYTHFLKTRDEMDQLDNKYNYEYIDTPKYSKSLFADMKRLLKEKNIKDFNKYSKTVNNIYKMTYNKDCNIIDINVLRTIMENPEYFNNYKNVINTMIKKYNKKVYAETYLQLFNNVRKIEYYLDPIKYYYNYEVFRYAVDESNWDFENVHLSDKQKLILAIFGEVEQNNDKDNVTFNYINYDSKIYKDILGVRLTKKLSDYSRSRK